MKNSNKHFSMYVEHVENPPPHFHPTALKITRWGRELLTRIKKDNACSFFRKEEEEEVEEEEERKEEEEKEKNEKREEEERNS